MIVGIRPENATIVTEPSAGAVACELELEMVETRESKALLHTTVNGDPFVIRTETLGNLSKLGAVKSFTVVPDLIKVFDATTGLALSGQTRVA